MFVALRGLIILVGFRSGITLHETRERLSYIFDPEPIVRLAVLSHPTQMFLAFLVALYPITRVSCGAMPRDAT